MSKKVYICYNPEDGLRGPVGDGGTLKAAYDDYIEAAEDNGDEVATADNCTFIEGDVIDVEVKIQRKEVVTKITAAPKPVAKNC